MVRDTERGSASPKTVTYKEGRDVGEEGMLCVISDFSDRSHVPGLVRVEVSCTSWIQECDSGLGRVSVQTPFQQAAAHTWRRTWTLLLAELKEEMSADLLIFTAHNWLLFLTDPCLTF